MTKIIGVSDKVANFREFRELHAKMMRIHYHSAALTDPDEFMRQENKKNDIKKILLETVEKLFQEHLANNAQAKSASQDNHGLGEIE